MTANEGRWPTRRLHVVHPGNPGSPDADGIVSVQRNFLRSIPDTVACTYWGVGRPDQDPAAFRNYVFRPVIESAAQRPLIPLSLRFAVGMSMVRRQMEPGTLRFDRIESAVPFLRWQGPKALFLHVWELHHVVGRHSDSRWRSVPGLYDRLLDRVVGRIDRVYVLDDAVGHAIADRVPGIEARVRTFSVPVDVDRFAPLEGPRRAEVRRDLLRGLGIAGEAAVVLFAGRLERVKRPLVLPVLAAALRDRTPPVHVLVAGTGSLSGHLREAAGRDAPGRVHLLGAVRHQRMPELLAAADALILPSGFEAVPNVVLESLACGTPVVASRTGALTGIVRDGRTGLLAGEDPGDLAVAMRRVLDLGDAVRSECRRAALPFAHYRVNAELVEDLLGLAPAGRRGMSQRADPLRRAPEPAVPLP